jgi:molecular chaperone HscA
LAEFNLSGIPSMPAGLAKVEVSFLINADGILNVKAKELRSGVEQSIEVKPQYGLTDVEVEKMLMESIQHASEDIKTRALVEAKTEAQQLIDTTQKFLNKNAEFLLPEEIAKTTTAIDDLRSSLDSENKDLINQKTESLNEISRPYAERVMDMAISKALSGKSIKDSI